MIAATRAWVAMFPIALACVTSRVHPPPARGRRSSAQLAWHGHPAAHGHREHLAVDDLQGHDRAAGVGRG